MTLEGRVALITGGAAGLGRAEALALAERGADIAVVDLGAHGKDVEPGYALAGESQLDETARDIEALGRRSIAVQADVRRQEDLDRAVARTIEELGGLHILVATAGICFMGKSWEMSRSEWDLQLETNLTGVWQSCKAVVPHMIGQRYGRIILKSSTVGLKPWKDLAGYSATKAGVIALGRSLALEVGEHNITVNSICPGTIPSGTNRGVAARHDLNYDEFLQNLTAAQVIKEIMEPSDVGNAVAYLASDEARYITGIAWPVDAGWTIM